MRRRAFGAFSSAWMQESEAMDSMIFHDDIEVICKKMLKALDLDSSPVKGVVV